MRNGRSDRGRCARSPQARRRLSLARSEDIGDASVHVFVMGHSIRSGCLVTCGHHLLHVIFVVGVTTLVREAVRAFESPASEWMSCRARRAS